MPATKIGTGINVQCNACRGEGWYYLSAINAYAYGGSDWFSEPTFCIYCDGSGEQEVVKYVATDEPAEGAT